MTRALLVLAVLAVLGGGGYLVHELRSGGGDATAALAPDGVEPGTPATAAAARRSSPPVDVKTVADLDRVLAGIESGARTSGRVLDDEIARGHAAILAMAATLGRDATMARGRTFDRTMRRLQHEAALKPTHDELARITAALATERDTYKRERLVSEYRTTARQLPPAHRAEAMAKLAQR